MKKSLSLLVLIGSAYLNACGGSSGGGLAPHIATHFSVQAPVAANAGTDFTFTVSALDAINNDVNYSGTGVRLLRWWQHEHFLPPSGHKIPVHSERNFEEES